ncbi:protein-L-isoaspartate(D-aspartate) O-methyltransferase [methane-oxidizing endosymbiont of Gigantopelta aegis]|uniref:protein-L-isoaspartate(D-aspartate) O-methyltransferase n=1 Tax=methane-oxidizing endosymbiont of Gigantopelta aegis TaxID=2794938 RepID=UPI0018DC009A|nr:protein-L-isoaspartate(D-aspartate) O-methyltransferase [methane-oxidizing endosymbiont of Gigantopelta aegis]
MNALQRMIKDIEQEARLTRHLTGKEALDPRVIAAMRQVPRHAFVPEDLTYLAYENGPIPIGAGQTISQPYIVALMTDLLKTRPTDRILEIGTGSGYQAAVLSQLVQKVYSIEIIESLAEKARSRLSKLGYDNVEIRTGDGYFGWPEHAPYDGVIVTAAAPYIPPALIEQLKNSGRLVIPVGLPYGYQELKVIEKTDDGELKTQTILSVSFVPLTGKHDLDLTDYT